MHVLRTTGAARLLATSVMLTGVALLAACTGGSTEKAATPASTAAKATVKAAATTAPTTAATPAATAKSTATAAGSPAAAAPAAPTTGLAVKDTPQGKIIVDHEGRTLYTFNNDPTDGTRSVCNGNCANIWPPAFAPASGNATKPAELTGALTVVTRDDGTRMLAYRGQPLYRFRDDTATGDMKGEAIANWLFARP
jgi:predicted lipoprotein with Yx(FWY)xxD motif